MKRTEIASVRRIFLETEKPSLEKFPKNLKEGLRPTCSQTLSIVEIHIAKSTAAMKLKNQLTRKTITWTTIVIQEITKIGELLEIKVRKIIENILEIGIIGRKRDTKEMGVWKPSEIQKLEILLLRAAVGLSVLAAVGLVVSAVVGFVEPRAVDLFLPAA
ncbi:hypothetical protein QYM36_001983 [Artemia franciscana]|uniref:Uncharacterized protein n=1 Tax=Artemia franciscana TaxID=6661 RepID=A0AA88I8W4_ARTSF|nr:hypothetical protein QYM36_001983 [Artemia franciscana]